MVGARPLTIKSQDSKEKKPVPLHPPVHAPDTNTTDSSPNDGLPSWDVLPMDVASIPSDKSGPRANSERGGSLSISLSDPKHCTVFSEAILEPW